MKYVFCFVILVLSLSLTAQRNFKRTFRAYVQAGPTINQISGDSVKGFNYWGFTGGIGTYMMMSKRVSLNLELNYVMRGASGFVYDPVDVDPQYHRTIHTNYIDLPLMVNYHDAKIARFGLGFVTSVLIDTKQWYNGKRWDTEKVKQYYNPLAFGIVALVSFDIKKHFGLTMNMIHSVVPINRKHVGEENQYHIDLSIKGVYYF